MKYKRKSGESTVEARKIGEDGEILILLDENKKSKVFAQAGEWLITEQDGRQYILSDAAFRMQFDAGSQLLLD